MIEELVREITGGAQRLSEEGTLTPKAKHIAVAAQLQFIEYLDALLEKEDLLAGITSIENAAHVDEIAELIADRMNR